MEGAQTAPAAPAARHGTAIVEAVDVVKTYRTDAVAFTALRGVSLAVGRGEMVSIMGPSGCGKTTLLNCLSGLDEVDSGAIYVDGNNIAELSDRVRTAFRARHMGFVFQLYNLLPVLTAAENVELPLLVSGVPARKARQRAVGALELVGLGARTDYRPAQLSGGERQRVTIARALVNDPAIVWADEPTGDLDSTNAREIMDLMTRLNAEREVTLVIVSHDRAVGERAHRILHMKDGQVVNEERLRSFSG